MSKEAKRKAEATELSIQEMDKQQKQIQAAQKRDELNDKKERARPFLISRIGIGLVDFLFTAILALGMFFFSYFLIFPSLGYQSSSETLISAYEDSHLYVFENGQYNYLTNYYDENKTPEENYDVPITYFYTTNQRAIDDNQMEKYTERKIASGYYEYNSEHELVRTSIANNDAVRSYLKEEYSKAVDYLFSDTALIEASNKMFIIMSATILIVVSISSIIFYIAVPLIDKKGRTFSYMMFKVMPVDSTTLGPVNWKRILLRSFIFIIITYISPVTIATWLNGISFAFIPFFINTAIICFSRSNSGLHDYATKINIINRSFSNPMENLNAINNGGNNDEYSINK